MTVIFIYTCRYDIQNKYQLEQNINNNYCLINVDNGIITIKKLYNVNDIMVICYF